MATLRARCEKGKDLRLRSASHVLQFPVRGQVAPVDPSLDVASDARQTWHTGRRWWQIGGADFDGGRDDVRLRSEGKTFSFGPKLDTPDLSSVHSGRTAELEHLVWEQSLALISRCTQLADLCNKHQQQADEINDLRSEIARLNTLQTDTKRDADESNAQARRQIGALEMELKAERDKVQETRLAYTDLQKRLLRAETRLNHAHLLVVMASEKVTAVESELTRRMQDGVRLNAELDRESKAHRNEVDRLRAFHIACITELRTANLPPR